MLMQPDLLTLKKWYDQHEENLLRDFLTFLSFPSIATDPQYAQATRQTALWLVDYLEQMGLKTALWETSGQPVVFGSYLEAGPSRPTLLIYNHYDVQPVDPIELWHADPFKPVFKDRKIY